MNNFRHGGAATSLFLPGEDPREFFALLENAFEQHTPAFDQDAALVTDSVRARWILTRRQRAAERHEADILRDAGYIPTTNHLELISVFDRYITQAERSLLRALKSLQFVQKMAHQKEVWQRQFESEKQKLSIHVERWEHSKARAAENAPPPPFKPYDASEDSELEAASLRESLRQESQGSHQPPADFTNSHMQVVYISYEDGLEEHYETSPTNDQLRPEVGKSDIVARTYNFVGGVPPSYQELLRSVPAKDVWRRGSSTSISKVYTHDQWIQLITKESRR